MNIFRYENKGTIILILINVVIFTLANLLSLLPINENVATVMGGSYLYGIVTGEVWRLVTANFLQLGILHIGFNLYALYHYGTFIELFYSTRKLFIIYFVSGVAGTLLSLSYLNSITFGASAAVWGLIGVMVGESIRANTYSPGLPIDIKSQFSSVLLWLFAGFAMPGISALGHLGGFIGGFVLGLILDTKNTYNTNKIVEIGSDILYYVSFGITIISFILMFVGIFS